MIEFFSGTGRMAEAFSRRGFKTVTVDLNYKSDFMVNVLDLTREDIINMCGGIPSVMWFGTPCEGFSVAAIGKNWIKDGNIYLAKSQSALNSELLALKCLDIISWFPKTIFTIENPRGMLRKMPYMKKLNLRTVTYCQFGENRMKPTDIWTNNEKWNTPLPCKNGDPCHVAAPRGSRTGTQGIKGAYLRGVYPVALCESFVNSVVSS